ncbi:MAG TPA: RluA family pseudouridine synthase [Tenuifilaceae bacterium]|nr:RluA family pseudouridine synthase [Tenuifilaceae bacterium]HOZ15715.1 RluA family pseudouridine synthase [Tenuifilaceae bacterium]HPI44538.1 RluA family pseudouridine synthase [Tenuifilaceae bacterium]
MAKKEYLHKPEDAKRREIRLTVTEEIVLMKFLLTQIPYKNRDNFKTLLNDRQIRVNGSVVTWYNHPLKPGQEVTIGWFKMPSAKQYPGIKVLFEDQHIIVIEKDSGVLSIATDKEKDITAYSMLRSHVKEQGASNKIFIVHRIDKETSGVMIFAKNEAVKTTLQKNWNDSVLERTYIAVVEGAVEQPTGTIVSYLKESAAFVMYSCDDRAEGQKAITHYKVLKQNAKYTLLKVNLETGRKNQIRVHMQDIGHSVIGDKKYGSEESPIGRLGLHAQVLAFTHPVNGKPMRFETQIPKAFLKLF